MRKFLLGLIFFIVLVFLFPKPQYAQMGQDPGLIVLEDQQCKIENLNSINTSGGKEISLTITGDLENKDGLRGDLVIKRISGGNETEEGRVAIDNKQLPFSMSVPYTGNVAPGDRIQVEVDGFVSGNTGLLEGRRPYRGNVSCGSQLGTDKDTETGEVILTSIGGKMDMSITPLRTIVDCSQNKFHCDETNATEEPYSDSELERNNPKYFQEDSTKRAIVTIKNVSDVIKDNSDSRKSFYLCLKSDGCNEDDDYLSLNESPLSNDGNFKIFQNNGNDIAFYICPSGKKDLKVQKDCDKTLPPFKFYGGNNYKVGLYEKYKGTYNLLAEKDFFMNYAFPYVFVNGALIGDGGWLSQRNIPRFTHALPFKLPLVKGTSSLRIILAGRKAGDSDASGGNGSNAAGTNNNYQLKLTNSTGSYEEQICTSVLSYNIDSQAVNKVNIDNKEKITEAIFGLKAGLDINNTGSLPPGRYRLEIREQVNEKSNCDGGPALWNFEFEVANNTNTDPAKGPTRKQEPYIITLVSQTMDPSSLNLKTEGLHEVKKGTFRCLVDENNNCVKLKTALGEINLTPAAFITQAFRILLSLAGIIAIFVFILNGYKLLTSAGDKQKIADAREKIQGTIFGILFIILSFVILEFIGNDILRIPGFGWMN